MSQKRAGGIFASSFVAGLLLAAAIFSPRAWEPVPGPYFGLEDQTVATSEAAGGMEAAHAELSARAQARLTAAAVAPVSPAVMPPVAAPVDDHATTSADVALSQTPIQPATAPGAPRVAEPVALAEPPASHSAKPPTRQPADHMAVIADPPEHVSRPPQRVAIADTASPAAAAAP